MLVVQWGLEVKLGYRELTMATGYECRGEGKVDSEASGVAVRGPRQRRARIGDLEQRMEEYMWPYLVVHP